MANSQTIDMRSLLKLNSTQVDHPRSRTTCWLLGTLGAMSHEVVGGNQTNKFSFEILDLEPHPEVEEGLLEKINLKNLRSPYSKGGLRVDYWITPDSLYHLSDMLDRVIGDPERSIEERLPETKGQRVMFKINPVQQEVNGQMVDTGQNAVDSRTVTIAEAREEAAAA